MKRVLRVILLALPLSFLIGLWWGRLQTEKKQNLLHPKYDLKILSQKHTLPINLIEAFEEETGLKVEIIETEDSKSLRDFSNFSQQDVIIYKSYNYTELNNLNKFAILNVEKINAANNILVDFWPSKKYDSNKAIPYSWGVNGFIGKKESQFDLAFASLFSDSPKSSDLFYFSTDFDALYFIMIQNKPEWKNYIEKNKVDLLQAELMSLKNKIRFSNKLIDINNSQFFHASNGQAAKFVKENKDFQFYIPEKGSLFWMNFISLTKTGHQNPYSYEFIDFLLSKKIQSNTLAESELASVTPATQSSPLLSGDYIRNIPLPKLHYFNELKDPKQAWQSSIKLSFSDLLSDELVK